MKNLNRLPLLLWLSSLALLMTLVVMPARASSPHSEHFVRPPEFEPAIAFWRRVYTEVTTSGGLLHDPDDLSVVYEVMQFPSDISPKARAAQIEQAKKKYARILERLASGAEDLSKEELRVQALWPKGTRRSRFEQASESVRFQLGQADRFREGLVRSGAWYDHIAKTFERMGLPRELAALPHVESSFNPYAYSKVGAAGMWQFMRSTGRRFLRIDATVDERLDPYRSTEAAARFLEQNYIVLGTWPLALTAYNHGPGGMKRAQEQLGTSDIATILRKYNSRSFGFASRNFYLAFLAALEIDSNPEKFFPGIRRVPPDNSVVLKLPQAVSVGRLASVLEMDKDELRRLNPALLNSVWRGGRPVPRGYEFRVPPHIDLTATLAKLKTVAEPAEGLLAGSQYRVESGDTLSAIASRHGVSMAALAELNNLERPYRLRVGQVLTLPEKGGKPAAVVAQTPKETAPPAPAAKPTPPTGVVGSERYVVRRGDTLSKIARQHGLTEEQLMEMNNIRNRQFIYEGQVLALAPSARAKPPVEAEVSVATVAAVTAPAPSSARAEEPVSEREAEEVGPALVPGTQAAASADPADYSVKDNMAIVQAAETLGHYAEWLEVRASRLRELNRMSHGTPVVIGRKVKLDFSKVTPDQFEARRIEYHRALQEAFFNEYRIQGTSEHVIKRGESVWVLAQQRYNIPIWLLRQYNPDIDLGSLRPGARLVIPLVESTAASEPSA
jgi:membrane-bound lytic murein transglycosylase D